MWQKQPYWKIVPIKEWLVWYNYVKGWQNGKSALWSNNTLANLQTCLLIPLHIVSISYSSKCRPARWIQVPPFIHSAFLHPLYGAKCQSADLPIYSPAYFLTHLNADLLDEYRFQFIYCTFLHPPSADLPTCLLLLPMWPIIVLIQPNYILVY